MYVYKLCCPLYNVDCVCIIFRDRIFRIMDDDGSKTLNMEEFKKGLKDYGVTVSEAVRGFFTSFCYM